ncbi:ABC transporter permease [Nocardioides immobilis]|uniref:ABC transporter permease n=1 Tax=Nocardioides immobilis TaxID=2049295 RepID=A0A417Y8I7_9ACTN|nr:ABC transporter permease [Nocardioides immobilis]RHW28895.1 ABC transporter permease [Nocardioides immobilis]
MLAITFADLRMRFRQFFIAVVGAGVTFALALLLSGMVSGFHNEIDRTVASAEADGWVVQSGTSGPFTSTSGIPGSTVSELASVEGIDDASGMVLSLQSVFREGRDPFRIMMIGADVGRPGQVTPDEGEPVGGDDEAVADERLGLEIGETFTLGGSEFEIVGLVSGLTMLGGTPNAWISLPAAQDALFQGEDIVTTIVVQGEPEALPDGLVVMTNDEVEEDSLGPMKDAVSSVDASRYLMWAVATIIVAALIYVSALQRTRDFAVLKAVGASSTSLFLGVALQAVLVCLAAAAFAFAVSGFLRPLYKVPVEVPGTAYLLTPLIAIGVGLLSSLVALRQAVKADPALAFGGS